MHRNRLDLAAQIPPISSIREVLLQVKYQIFIFVIETEAPVPGIGTLLGAAEDLEPAPTSGWVSY
jgi:hypothetical protein